MVATTVTRKIRQALKNDILAVLTRQTPGGRSMAVLVNPRRMEVTSVKILAYRPSRQGLRLLQLVLWIDSYFARARLADDEGASGIWTLARCVPAV